MSHTENFMKECGIKWKSFGTLHQITESLDWVKIENSTRSYERRGYGSRMVHHPKFVLMEILEHGYININDGKAAKEAFGLGPVFDKFPEELYDFIDFDLSGSDTIDAHIPLVEMKNYLMEKTSDETKTKIYPEYVFDKVFNPEQARDNLRVRLGTLRREMLKEMEQVKDKTDKLFFNGLYNALLKDYPEAMKNIQKEKDLK